MDESEQKAEEQPGSTSAGKESSEPSPPTIRLALESFVRDAESLVETLPMTMLLVEAATAASKKEMKTFLETRSTPHPGGDKNLWDVPIHEYQEYLNRKRVLDRQKTAARILPRSFVVSLLSVYDAFVGALMRAIFYLKPEVLNASDHSLTFKDLTNFRSLKEARDFVVEKEVENLLRKSHVDQFDALEGRFKLPLRKDLPIWPSFVEIAERRNLFVHANGVVSTQYIKVCEANGYKCSKTKLGDELRVSPEYFQTAYAVVFEMGTKLAHVLWRKLSPDDMSDADANLNDICLDLIRDEKYALATKLLDFAVSMKKHASDVSRRIMAINRAQAYKWLGEQKMTRTILDAEDWSAVQERFRLAKAVLLDDFDDAAKLMKKIGPDGPPAKGDYKEWPLFKEFRKSNQFGQAYQEVFGEPFAKISTEKAGGDQTGPPPQPISTVQ